jgi:heme/copper-type cytochrome/quinol oxidase subunit 4
MRKLLAFIHMTESRAETLLAEWILIGTVVVIILAVRCL